MTIGDTVFVRWYGDVVEGLVVNNDVDNSLLGKMIAVRIPLQGMHAIALFFPEHVYQTADEAGDKTQTIIIDKPVDSVYVQSDTTPGTFMIEKTKTVSVPIENFKELVSFKETHWDHEHNHLQIEALNDFYELWKACSKPILIIPKVSDAEINKLAEEFANYDGKIYIPENKIIEYHPEADAYDGGPKPEIYQQATDVVQQQRMQVSDEKMAELESQLKKALAPAKPKAIKTVKVIQLNLFE